ncbi:hypothetical protein TREMEDRAFT_66260 [Tremella mesenterica DSM 1558]|uniref:uncharacterized protein n=1 Tax=Tremella mesenterica (strain ATCC 24925 / CBS 8224 / DSM 1558 / NBRC 9311 / NRRL Y-6157 / RJB 2259-6 / UBC 559-6) TaxID=578456 RepID=UPI00032C9ED7|nr:uncharacterized protein TREMEDRAFT_66260 [Tremella mesenterica DSM 1558]EIW65671.1 hypothetical protein TREMEDRAFT_66260 [Tremella mesenterica DSM 1558]
MTRSPSNQPKTPRGMPMKFGDTVVEFDAQYTWDVIVGLSLRKWPNSNVDSVVRIPDDKKSSKVAILPNESSKLKNHREAFNHAVSPNVWRRTGSLSCSQCQGRQNRSNSCAFGCLTVGEIPTGACCDKAEIKVDERAFLGSLREELGSIKAVENQAKLAAQGGYNLEAKGIAGQLEIIRTRISDLIATQAQELAPDDASVLETPRKRMRKSTQAEASPF